MNATNVDYYVVGFKSDGSRATGKICMFDPVKHPDKLETEASKMKADNADIVTVKAVTTADYMNLLGNNTDGKEYILSGETFVPYVAPEPTDEEKKAAEKASLEAEYESNKSEMLEALQAAQLAGNTDAVTSIQKDYQDMTEAYKTAVEEVG